MRLLSGGVEEMDVDRKKVKTGFLPNVLYKISFSWYKDADKLSSEQGMPTGVIRSATPLCNATHMRNFVNEWFDFDLGKEDRKKYRRMSAQFF